MHALILTGASGSSSSAISMSVYFPGAGVKEALFAHLFLVLSENFFSKSFLALARSVGPFRALAPGSP